MRRGLVAALAFLSIAATQREGASTARPSGLPLVPERRVEFTTDEGTWISVDVSPDGQTLVFDLLGDLYSLPIAGGKARRLTSGLPFDFQPRFSPDGRRLVFLSDRDGAENVWTMTPDGADLRQITRDQRSMFASPSWTPDGDAILVSRRAPYMYDAVAELWQYDTRGGSGVALTHAKATATTPEAQWHNALDAVSSPDGRTLYYAQRLGGLALGDTPAMPGWQVARRDRETGDEDRITQNAAGAFHPVLSRDGRLLAYGVRRDAATELRLRDLETGEDRRLVASIQRDDQESFAPAGGLLPGFNFLPDGRALVLAWGGKLRRVDVATGAASVIPFSADVALDLGASLDAAVRMEDGPVRGRLISGARVSPDGRRLAFSAFGRLHVVDFQVGSAGSAPAAVPARLTTGEMFESQPAWSPDGLWIAYVTWSQDGGHVFKVRADGKGDPERLTDRAAFYRDPVWSTDGTRLVALRASRQARLETRTETPLGLEVIWMPASNGPAHLITPARGLSRPHFGPEPDRIYFYAGHDLVSTRWDGTDRRRVLSVVMRSAWGRPDILPWLSQAVMSPDGEHALLQVRDQLYVVALPRNGADAPAVDIDAPVLPLRKITLEGADDWAWADGGAAVAWSVGSTFRRARVAALFANADPKTAVESMKVNVERPRLAPEGSVVLRGADVVTMRGDEVIRSADIVVTGSRIAAVGRTGTVKIPGGATVIDVRGNTIIPGLVDTHDHLSVRRDVLEPQPWSFLVSLAYGITSARDPQAMRPDLFAYEDMVDAGQMIGPRVFSTGQGIFYVNDFKTAEETDAFVSRYAEHYRTHTIKSYLVGNRRQRQWVIAASRKYGLMPTTEGGSDLRLDLTHAIDGFSGNEHNLPVVPLHRDVIELFARSSIFYTPTIQENTGGPHAETFYLQREGAHDDARTRRFVPHATVDARTRRAIFYPEDEHMIRDISASAAKIVRAGGRVCVGSHGNFKGLGTHWEMWGLASNGLTPLEAIRAGTLCGAQALGVGQDLGSLEAGKLADLVVLSKSPLQNIRNTSTVRYVMKNGVLHDAERLDEVWPTKKTLPTQWWWKEDAAAVVRSDAPAVARTSAPTKVGALATFKDCPECPEMVTLPAGSFAMGSPETELKRKPHESPRHTVTFAKPFAMGKYEVTFDEWDACVAAKACEPIGDSGWGRGRRPAVYINFEMAMAYARWLSARTGKSYRVPSEAEWEYAARGGVTTPWSWGEDAKRACEFGNVGDQSLRTEHPDWTLQDCSDGFSKTSPVGTFKPNGFGLYDTVGNAWEWVEDCYNPSYDGAPTDGRAWLTGDCVRRVDRGGGWYNDNEKLRAALRYAGDDPTRRNNTLGFRVARSLP